MINELKHISVLNYNENCVCINIAPNKSVVLEAASYGEPTVLPLTLDEIRYANNSSVFKTGTLEFSDDVEDEMYELLRIDKNNILKLKDIREILLSPTKDGLLKILSMTSSSNFDRVRGQFQKLKHEGYKLTLDIDDLIKRRTSELFNNQIKTSIVVDDADTVNNDKSRVAELEKEIAEMKKLLEIAVSSNDVAENKEHVKVSEVHEKKSPGRAKKTV